MGCRCAANVRTKDRQRSRKSHGRHPSWLAQKVEYHHAWLRWLCSTRKEKNPRGEKRFLFLFLPVNIWPIYQDKDWFVPLLLLSSLIDRQSAKKISFRNVTKSGRRADSSPLVFRLFLSISHRWTWAVFGSFSAALLLLLCFRFLRNTLNRKPTSLFSRSIRSAAAERWRVERLPTMIFNR